MHLDILPVDALALSFIFDRHSDIRDKITSGRPEILEPNWYLDAKFKHLICYADVHKTRPGDIRNWADIAGDIYYETDSEFGITEVHIAMIDTYASYKWTKEFSKLAMGYMKSVGIQAMSCTIAKKNRAANMFVNRLGFKKLEEKEINGIPANIYARSTTWQEIN